MRHKKKFNHLGRKRGHRKAMLSNMSASLIMHKRIKTTIAKAKALKMVIEPVITKAKDDTTHARREAFRLLQDKEAVTELFREIAVKVGDRPGGYTRIIKLGARLGDSAEMCIIELVDYNENMLAEKAAASKSRRRRGGKKKSQAEGETTTEAAVEVVEETAEGLPDELVEEVKTEEPKAPAAEAPEVKEEPKAEAEEKKAPAAEAPEAKEKPADDGDEEKKAE